MRKLILFDIDGTLIQSNGVGSKAMCRTMASLVGRDDSIQRVEMAGMCDWGIWREALASEGFTKTEADAQLPDLWRRYILELATILASPEHKHPEILPGVYPLLEALHQRDDVLLGLLTGNVEAGARLKLGKVGLGHFFPFGAFGDDAAERAQLPLIAVERAAPFAEGKRFTGKEIVIIGDTIHDVYCGVTLGVCAVAVATGPTDAATLRATGADFVFESLEQTDEVLRALLGSAAGKVQREIRYDSV
ncbi:MAG: HAD family hydrolase [Ardenticatenaceae bacterium]